MLRNLSFGNDFLVNKKKHEKKQKPQNPKTPKKKILEEQYEICEIVQNINKSI